MSDKIKNQKGRVLVTGADGFIGSHLTELLLAEGYSVRALSYYNSFNFNGWLEEVKNVDGRLEIVSGDVRDPFLCRQIVEGCDMIFHLAALIAIPYSYIAPDSYVDTNIKGTLNICEAARYAKVKKIIITSTSEVYGTALTVPIDESHPRQPQSPYSATKIGADAIAMSFYNSFSLPVVIARPFNTFGPRQSARAIIPTIITQIANGAKEIKTGDLRPTRDFNFVKDTARGFLALAQTDNIEGQEFNIASGTEISMKDTLMKIAEIMGKEVKYITEECRLRPEKSEVMRLCGDSSKIREITGWKPEVSFDDALKTTIEWFVNPENLIKYKWDVYNR